MVAGCISNYFAPPVTLRTLFILDKCDNLLGLLNFNNRPTYIRFFCESFFYFILKTYTICRRSISNTVNIFYTCSTPPSGIIIKGWFFHNKLERHMRVELIHLVWKTNMLPLNINIAFLNWLRGYELNAHKSGNNRL